MTFFGCWFYFKITTVTCTCGHITNVFDREGTNFELLSNFGLINHERHTGDTYGNCHIEQYFSSRVVGIEKCCRPQSRNNSLI